MPAWRVIASGVLLGPLAAPFSTCLAHEVPHSCQQQYRWVDGSPGAKFRRTYTPYSKNRSREEGGRGRDLRRLPTSRWSLAKVAATGEVR